MEDGEFEPKTELQKVILNILEENWSDCKMEAHMDVESFVLRVEEFILNYRT